MNVKVRFSNGTSSEVVREVDSVEYTKSDGVGANQLPWSRGNYRDGWTMGPVGQSATGANQTDSSVYNDTSLPDDGVIVGAEPTAGTVVGHNVIARLPDTFMHVVPRTKYEAVTLLTFKNAGGDVIAEFLTNVVEAWYKV